MFLLSSSIAVSRLHVIAEKKLHIFRLMCQSQLKLYGLNVYYAITIFCHFCRLNDLKMNFRGELGAVLISSYILLSPIAVSHRHVITEDIEKIILKYVSNEYLIKHIYLLNL